MTSLIGMGYYGTHTPAVIRRNVLENPAWYTAYTPYQPEISQGRLEALLNFQTMVADLTGLDIANASLLDEATAAAEAMTMARRLSKVDGDRFFVHHDVHPADARGARHPRRADRHRAGRRRRAGARRASRASAPCSAIRPRPAPSPTGRRRSSASTPAGGIAVVATDLLACVLLRSPGELGADIAVGSAQRFGVPMGYGGPHAGFIAVRESASRALPGRLVGVSTDTEGRPALRLALQTARAAHPPREGDVQHLHRAGAARQHRRVLRGVARRRRAAPDRRPCARVGGAARRPSRTTTAARCATTPSSTRWWSTASTPRAVLERAACAGFQPAARGRRRGRHRLRRDDHAGDGVGGRRGASPASAIDDSQLATAWSAIARVDAARRRVPHPGAVPRLPQRARHAALPAPPRRPRPGARPHDDPARLVHDEAQRGDGDGADHVAGVRQRPSVRPRRPDRGLPGDDRRARGGAVRDHRLRRRQPATQRRQPGRVRRAAGDPRLPPQPRRRRPHRLPDPVERPRHERRQRGDGGDAGRRGALRRPRQRRPRRPQGQDRRPPASGWRRSW